MSNPEIGRVAFEAYLSERLSPCSWVTHPGGWRQRQPGFVSRLIEAWLVLIGKHSLNRAYQKGYEDRVRHDSAKRKAQSRDAHEAL